MMNLDEQKPSFEGKRKGVTRMRYKIVFKNDDAIHERLSRIFGALGKDHRAKKALMHTMLRLSNDFYSALNKPEQKQ